MTEDREIQRLVLEERPPDAPAARERTAAAARATVAATTGQRVRSGGRLAIAGLLGAAVVGLAFTPPGRAVTGEVAEVVGIGAPATLDHSEGDTLTSVGEAIVIGRGATAGGERYELVAFEGRVTLEVAPVDGREVAPGPPAHPGTCLKLDWIDRANSNTGATCSDAPQTTPLSFDVLGEDNGSKGPAQLVVEGMAGPEVADVEVTYENARGERVTAESTLGRVVGSLAERIGASHEFGWFVAFIPAQEIISGGNLSAARTKIHAVAYGEDGEEIARDVFGQRG